MNPLISVVTVCWNAEVEIGRTISSVMGQDYHNIEYIIVDGLSTDSTIKIIEQYIGHYPTFNFVVISEKDNGIYDAMNKGINCAHGDWILFLNAGDCFYDNSVLSDVNNELDLNVDFVYGDALYIAKDEEYPVKGKSISNIKYHMPFCHQCVFNNRATINKYLYNGMYKICADYDLYLTAFMDGRCFKYINRTISNYEVGGFSQKNQWLLVEEIVQIRAKNNLVKNLWVETLKIKSRVYLGRLAKILIPHKIIKLVRKKVSKYN